MGLRNLEDTSTWISIPTGNYISVALHATLVTFAFIVYLFLEIFCPLFVQILTYITGNMCLFLTDMEIKSHLSP